MKRVLVPIDFGKQTPAVLEHVAQLVKLTGAHVRLLHAVAPDPDFVGYEVDTPATREQTAKDFRDDHRRLEATAAEMADRGIDIEPLLVQGPTVEVILDHAKRYDADLIVMGSHGHGTLYTALLGSTSQGVLHDATCPVLIVPVHDRNR